ncbi:MAG TPA: FixH family protein [Acetobacteraceae bacterium]|nr:FixH family protein [Acetobacteraceae bacterium]
MRPTLWRYFPLAIAAGLGFVVVVNAGMVYAALHSFPGKAGDEGFALSNHYDAVLEREQRANALGWTVAAQIDAAGLPEVRLSGADGAPLRGAVVSASAERPLGASATHALQFRETDAGRYIADTALPSAGQWDLTISVSRDGDDVGATRRLIAH